MTCDDSFENRRKLRTAKFMWTQCFDMDTGQPNGLIRAFTAEETTARRESVYERKKPLLVDASNPYSDFVGPDEMTMDADVPWWVKQHLRNWMQYEIDGTPDDKRRQFPVRCEVLRTDGTRCWGWAGNPKKAKRCKKHLAWETDADTANLQAAKIKFMQASPAMADTLEELATNDKENGSVRLKAATEILDRAGLRGGKELDVRTEHTVTDKSDEVKERLDNLKERMEEAAARAAARIAELEAASEPTDVVEAEVIDEPEE